MKKILALLTVVAVMLSCTAVFAEETVFEHVGGKYTVTYNGTADTMYGFVVIAPTITVEGEEKNVTYNVSNLSNSNLLYIDQQTADSTGKVTFSKFMLKEGATADENGNYGKVFIGGGEASATSLGFVGGEKVITGVKVSGTVADTNNPREAIVTLKDAAGETVDTENTVSGAYEFEEVMPGTYSIEIAKTASCTLTCKNVVVAEEEDVTVNADLSDYAGDVDGDKQVNALDISDVIKDFNKRIGEHQLENVNCDVDDDKQVNALDISLIIKNFNKSTFGE